MMNEFSSWHVGVSAEAYAAAIFARYGYDVSVQYGANQPEYDLIAVSGDKILKISVKGSKDGAWGLTTKYKKGHDYYDAVDAWLNAHHKKTVFCLVQFKNVDINEMPRIYIATPREIAERLKASAAGRGETILFENHKWTDRAKAKGTVDKIPDEWKITPERVERFFSKYGQ